MQILEDFYPRAIYTSERSFKHNSQYANALDEIVKVCDNSYESLNEAQKQLFEYFLGIQRG